MTLVPDLALEARARQSLGESGSAIYAAAARALRERGARGSVVDVGCGTGRLTTWMQDVATAYLGVDAVRYDGFPAGAAFLAADLNHDPLPVPDRSADVVVSLETIEHLENPRRFCRELVRITAPGGWVLVTTPNQRSLTSLGALLFKEHFSAFRDSCYPAHQTALLDTDLRRLAAENGLRDVAILYSEAGRMPLTAAFYPRAVSRLFPRACSDNVLLIARTADRSAA
jgi:2-polyprenyl-3-methyl-5-hydroxy-6-metoxy-1,4-benzoquinol methylase